MTDQYIKIPRAPDRSLIDFFKKISDFDDSETAAEIMAFGSTHVGTINLCKDDSEYPENLKLIIKKNSAIISQINLKINGLTIYFYRGGNVNRRGYNETTEVSAIYDEIRLVKSANQETNSVVTIEIVTLINKHLKAFDSKRGFSAATKEAAQYEAIHNSTIERLELLNEELISKTHNYRIDLDNDFSQAKLKLFTENEELKRKHQDEINQKKDELNEQIKAFDDKKKKLDDSSNTHARRKIRQDILEEIKKRQSEFKLTKGTNSLRRPIALMMLGLIAFFLAFTAISALEIYKILLSDNTNNLIAAGIRQALYSTGAVTSIIFMVRWMNRWFEQHSQSEFALKKFELDMERASWLVETSLEWKDAKGTSIPSELLDSLSANLFENDKKIEHVQHPVDQLASALLGSASTVKLKAGDSSIEVDPKKLAKKNLS